MALTARSLRVPLRKHLASQMRGHCQLPRAVLATALLAGMPPAAARPAAPVIQHRVVILIDSDNEKVMGHAVSYTVNIARSYAARNETVAVEVVANGSGIKLFRDDETPLRLPLAALRQQVPGIAYSMYDASRSRRKGAPSPSCRALGSCPSASAA